MFRILSRSLAAALLLAASPVLAQAPANPHGAHGASHAAAPAHQGAIKLERPWTRATPKGSTVAGGFVKIVNSSTTPDRLTGGTFAISKRVEVHEMAMIDGVMKMRGLSQGLVIGAGQSVELKPGSYHMMLMELTGPIQPGDRVKGTLTFEKAGPVEVEFVAAPVGASAPGGHGH